LVLRAPFCKKDRGGAAEDFLPSILLERIMVESDAPFMGFKKKKRLSEPADCVDVAKMIAATMDVPAFTDDCQCIQIFWN